MKNKEVLNELNQYRSLLIRRAELLGKLLALRNQFLEKQASVFKNDDVFAGLRTAKEREVYLEVVNKDILVKSNEFRSELFKINAEITFWEMYFSVIYGKNASHLDEKDRDVLG